MQKKTDNIQLQSLPKVEVVLSCLTLMDAISLQQSKSSYFGFIRKAIYEISNLDDRQLDEISIQDAISLLVYYRMYFWDDMDITESPVLKPSDFIGSFNKEVKKDIFITIKDYNFSPYITLKKAIDAETYCNTLGDIKNLRFYILGAVCTKTLKHGVDTMKSLNANSEDIGLLKQYDVLIGEISNIVLSLTDSSNKISIICEQGGGLVALPFQGSLFTSFGL